MAVDHSTIQAWGLCSNLPPRELDSVCERTALLSFEPNQLLFDCGTSCAILPLVLAGSVRVLKRSESGREIRL